MYEHKFNMTVKKAVESIETYIYLNMCNYVIAVCTVM